MVSHRLGYPPERLLLGPGPSNIHPRVMQALSMSIVGYTDPYLYDVLDEIRDLLRYVFQTGSEHTLAVSGTGTAGMEMVLQNLVEEGDEVVACVSGFFGERVAEALQRLGAKVIRVEAEWGEAVNVDDVKKALETSNASMITVVHGETSTGVLQPLKEIGKLAKSYDALLVVDAVTTLGGEELRVDELGVDACYSCSQKCIGCPPGVSPVMFSERAYDKIQNSRRRGVRSWYFDFRLVERYWGSERVYHHTPPINLLYALREALRLIHEEGVERRWARHRRCGEALAKGLEELGLELMVRKEIRLPILTTIHTPAKVDETGFRRRLLEEFGIEIGGGLGKLKGKIWRIGLMGYNAEIKNVAYLLHAFEKLLQQAGYGVRSGQAVRTAFEYYG